MSEADDRIEAILAQLGRPGEIRRHPATLSRLSYCEGPTGRIAYEEEGEGPLVLFVHGWQGSPRDFSSLMPAFQNAGARTVALDLPAHGASEGKTVSAAEAAAAVRAVADVVGKPAAIIAHSFGCLATTLALKDGLKAGCIVFFAPPDKQATQLRRIGLRNGLDEAAIERLIDRVRDRGVPVDAMDMTRLGAERSEPLFIIHSRDDEMTPSKGSQSIANAWPEAKLLLVDDLGHNMAMRDNATIAAVLRFTLGM